MGQNRLRSPSSSLIQAFHSQKTASTASGWSLFPPRPPLNLLSYNLNAQANAADLTSVSVEKISNYYVWLKDSSGTTTKIRVGYSDNVAGKTIPIFLFAIEHNKLVDVTLYDPNGAVQEVTLSK